MSLCWLNGTVLPMAAARIDPSDRGLTLGDGLFETIAMVAGRPRFLDRHLARLRAGAAVLELPCPWPDAAITVAIGAVAAGMAQEAVRITLTRGPAGRGVLPPGAPMPSLLITAAPLPPAGGPVVAVLCRTTCRNEASPLSRIKSLNYLDAILARLEARRAGAQDAILLNTADMVAEASAANLVALLHGRLVTPPVQDGALPGIARAVLLERAGITECSLHPADLFAAEAIILTNSLGLRELASLDGHRYAQAGPLLAALRAAVGS